MIKNDYRRALIMLRALTPGISGFVRLERRTLMGSLQFTITGAPAGAKLTAMILGQRNGRWRGVKLGDCGRDNRGQAGVNWSFDPRNIQGMELEEYDLAAVMLVRPGACELALSGFLNGSKEVDWAQVREVACSICSGGSLSEPVASLPESTEEAQPESAEYTQQAVPESTAGEEEMSQEAEEESPSCAFEETQAAPSIEADEDEGEVIILIEEPESSAQEQGEEPAAALLELDITLPWPEAIEPLRALFIREVAFQPFDAEGFVFIRAPMPTDSGISFCAVGIKCDEGQPRVVCYGIPGMSDVEPPPGLEGYAWQEGPQGGYWAVWQDAETGEDVTADWSAGQVRLQAREEDAAAEESE